MFDFIITGPVGETPFARRAERRRAAEARARRKRTRWVVMRRPGEFTGVDFLAEQPAGEVFCGWDAREVFQRRSDAVKETKGYGGAVVTEAHGKRMWRKYGKRAFGRYGARTLKPVRGGR